MNPETPLTIYEIRALDQEALKIFDDVEPRDLLGSRLAGLHWEADFAFIFFEGEPGPEAGAFLARHENLALRETHRLTYAQWQDGAGAEPFSVAGLCIAPKSAAAPGDLVIDPGLAFGFGGHPTTRHCLEFLGRACRMERPGAALDLGSGTGVLSLASAKLGVERVLGVDYSHLAVEAARNNVLLNPDVRGRVNFVRGAAQNFAREKADLLMANLHLSLQEELLDLGAFEERKFVIVSGLLPGEGEYLLSRLPAMKVVDQHRGDRWFTALLMAV